jgi:lactoylglutathione lyase
MVPTFGWCVVYVDDVQASSAFYQSAFGLSVRFMTPEGDYAELETGSTALALCNRALGRESTGLALDSRYPMSNITLVVEDVATLWQQAIESGARPQKPPATKPWGQVTAYVLDPDGHLVELATPVNS